MGGYYLRRNLDKKIRCCDESMLIGSWRAKRNTSEKITYKDFYYRCMLSFGKPKTFEPTDDKSMLMEGYLHTKSPEMDIGTFMYTKLSSRISTVKAVSSKGKIIEKCFWISEFMYIRFIDKDTFEICATEHYASSRPNSVLNSSDVVGLVPGVYYRI